jgi:hypothetical protein
MTKKQAIAMLGTSDTEEAIVKLKEARNYADRAEHDFLLLVEAFEVSELWRTLSCGTFEQALDLTHITQAKRYTRWKRARAELGDAIVTTIGVSGSTQAVRLESRTDRRKAVEIMLAVAAKEGTVVSPLNARSIVSKFFPPRSRVLDGAKRAVDLERENAALRRRVKELEAEVASLRERLRAAQTRGGKEAKKSTPPN